jgi:hypothetical protein
MSIKRLLPRFTVPVTDDEDTFHSEEGLRRRAIALALNMIQTYGEGG